MAEIIETTPNKKEKQKGFTVSLPVKDSKGSSTVRNIEIMPPTVITSRQFFQAFRVAADAADTSEIMQREKEVRATMAGASVEVITASKKELVALNELYSDADTNFYKERTKCCFVTLKTDLSYDEIDWDNADLQEVNTAINFFKKSTGGDKLAVTK
jgi:hypothetical protein